MSGVNRIHPALLPLLAVAPALSQQAGSAQGSRQQRAGRRRADRIEVQDRANRAILSGNVVATQGNMTMNSARLTVVYANSRRRHPDPAARGERRRAPAQPDRDGAQPVRHLRRAARLVTMIGGVNLDQGANHVQGGRLVLDLDTHRAVMDGGARRHRRRAASPAFSCRNAGN
jgi:lipopolysaccharide export system protein LptA